VTVIVVVFREANGTSVRRIQRVQFFAFHRLGGQRLRMIHRMGAGEADTVPYGCGRAYFGSIDIDRRRLLYNNGR
jgi:hypothetical protein